MEDASNVEIVASELRDHLRDIDQRVPIDWTQFDDVNLLKCFAILLCWGVDGMIRICGVTDDIQGTDNPESWSNVIENVNRRRVKITLADLAILYLEGVEFPAVLLLAYLELQYQRAGREIFRRVDLRPVGKQIVFWTDRFPDFKQEDLLKAFRPPKRILVRGKNISLSDPFRNTPKDRKEMERQSLNFLVAADFYKSLQGTLVDQCSAIFVPFSPVATIYPAPEAWEKAFPKLIQEQRAAHVAELLPILNGEMEKARLQVFNAYRKAFREELSWSAQKGEAGNVDDDTLKAVSKIHHGELEREALSGSPADATVDAKRARKILAARISALEKKSPQSTRSKIRQVADVYLFDADSSIAETARKTTVDKKTARKIIIELGISPLKPVKSRKKST